MQQSIFSENNLLTKYLKLKGFFLENEAQIIYKQHKNMLSTLMKNS